MKLERILYASHRYHTNQVPIMKGWYEKGVKVKFLAQYQGVSEVHDYVEFHQLSPSLFTMMYNWIADKIYNPSVAESKKATLFFPSAFDTIKQVYNFKPQLVILRNRSICNAIICLVCKLIGVKYIINYTQTELYTTMNRSKRVGNIAKLFFPEVGFTPVLYRGIYREKNYVPQEWFHPNYYIPLVGDISQTPKKNFFKDNVIHLLDVGKYRPYKNHYFLIDALSEVKNKDNFRLTIIGQLSQEAERAYYNELKKYVEDKGLSNIVSVNANVPFQEMDTIYENADVLVLPSKSETAGMVILEAMAKGLCVMSGNNCGLACYLEESNCGFVFDIQDTKQLVEQLNRISEDREIIKKYAGEALKAVSNNYSFQNYVDGLRFLMSDFFQEKLYIENY